MMTEAQATKRKRGQRGKGKAVSFVVSYAAAGCGGKIVKPTRERMRQQGGVAHDVPLETGSRVLGYRARCECILDVYHQRGQIDRYEHEAGLRFRRAWLRHVLGIRVDDSMPGAVFSQPGVNGAEDKQLRLSEAQRLINEALRCLHDEHQRMLVIGVCGQDETAGGTRNITVLRRALEAIARHWSLV
jgi:hypothetical protein